MTDLLPRVEAMLQGIVAEKVRDATRELERDRDAAFRELSCVRADYAFARETLEVERRAVREAEERAASACADRDKAVREAQALREQVQALELKLLKLLEARKVAEVEPAMPLEVGGFRVGDLVRPLHACGGAFVQVRQLWNGVVLTRTSAWCPGDLERKPVEVGDWVRVIEGTRKGAQGIVDAIIGGEARVVADPLASLGDAPWVSLPRLVAIAK